MAKLNIYSIHDKAVNAYMRPFFANSDGEAIRSFRDIANDAEHPIGKHPEDYALFRLGVFDDKTCKINPEEPDCIARAHELYEQSRKVTKLPLPEEITSPGGTA